MYLKWAIGDNGSIPHLQCGGKGSIPLLSTINSNMEGHVAFARISGTGFALAVNRTVSIKPYLFII